MLVDRVLLDINWGPVAAWAAAAATVFVALVALLASFRVFDAFRAPRIRITFEQREPWCRDAHVRGDAKAFWVRVGVENTGHEPARGCVGRVTALSTDGAHRTDIDPMQLRWAGVPRSRAFDPIDLRRHQREFLNVLALDGDRWRIVTFDDPGFDPGFSTELAPGEEHVLQIAVFADNVDTVTNILVARTHAGGESTALTLA